MVVSVATKAVMTITVKIAIAIVLLLLLRWKDFNNTQGQTDGETNQLTAA